MARPFLIDADFALYNGDAADVLAELPPASVECVVTSPPYWRLRDYADARQLGLEPTPALYVERMVDIFRGVRRVLREDGTVWVNVGDTYVGKELSGIPWRLALALKDDGWRLRCEIVWSKPNVMPESATDRPTRAHEAVFLFTRGGRYYYDADAIREAYEARPQQRLTPTAEQPLGKARAAAGVQNGPQGGEHRSRFEVQDAALGVGPDGRRKTTVTGRTGSLQPRDGERWPNPDGRNARSVWTIACEPFDGAHFAVMPTELARRCIVAGCPPGGTVLDPFAGTGTTALAARGCERRSIGIELNPAYCRMAAERTRQLTLLAAG
jgi:DNA modification methylase